MHNFACIGLIVTGLLIVRFFLGIAEAPYYPGALYLLSLFYTRKEIATRISILYSGNIASTAFAGLIAAATFDTLDGVHGIKGWQWLFIIEGVVTFGVAVFGIWMLPDFPLTTVWLTPEERELAHERVQRDTVGIAPSKGAKAGFLQAIKDPRLYLFAFMQNMVSFSYISMFALLIHLTSTSVPVASTTSSRQSLVVLVLIEPSHSF